MIVKVMLVVKWIQLDLEECFIKNQIDIQFPWKADSSMNLSL